MQNLTNRVANFTAVVGIGALLVSVGGCSTLNPQPSDGAAQQQETISYSVGPCFGFCPVYSVAVTPEGHVAYLGERHTAVLGAKGREAGEKAYDGAATMLAAFRPADGTTADTQCEERRTDAQHYVITWTKPDGTKTVLRHDRGCMSAKNNALNKALDEVPAQLGVADWAKQTTESGASRG
ncbi:DUF6438 domain-containing protein [Asticcacaulis benevestitus]|uniref:DUF6438 domain-containing protein n=1 Tax=Asticcacaulis benevestitus DSM 16100 = ATCC BAA-896 TaxID=1121022 RepID=V4PN32_9CAUL|nr:DUF6438 domain-containing protein [Asticcacaulis benevestitus]ESQ88684.1 hypothetical protein ABENE_15695 [Asticcacaulis benevestitus DSM 16100 = ATCC BAA-896]